MLHEICQMFICMSEIKVEYKKHGANNFQVLSHWLSRSMFNNSIVAILFVRNELDSKTISLNGKAFS